MSEAPSTTRADVLASLGTASLLVLIVATPFLVFTIWFEVSFANPAGFWLALLALPLLLLYVLKTRRPRRTIGSVLFWRPIAVDQQANHPFKRLRRNLVLLLLLLGLAACVYGLARPVVQGDMRDGRSIVILIDVSGSMSAVDQGGKSRFQASQEEALELVDALGVVDWGTVIAADREAWTVAPWTQDAGELTRAIRSLRPRHTGTQLADGLILAASACRTASGQPEVHLFSDGGGPTPPPIDLTGPLIHHRVGTASENVGVVSVDLQPRRGPGGARLAGQAGALAWEVFVRLRNVGARERSVFLSLEREGRLVAARKVTLAANADQALVLEARLPPGPVRVRLRPAKTDQTLDPFPLDDEAWVLVPTDPGVVVGLLGKAHPAIERALEAAGASIRRMDEATYREDPSVRLYVFDTLAPTDYPPRDVLLVSRPSDHGPIKVRPERPIHRIAGWDRDDPLLKFVDFSDVEVSKATPLLLGGGARALLQGEGPTGPVVLMASYREGNARRTWVGFDMADTTWALRASFPIFIRNVLEAAAARDHLASRGVSTGTPIAIPVGRSVTSVDVIRPDKTRVTLSAQGGQAYFADTSTTGVYTVEARSGDQTRTEQFCVNLASADESKIAPRPFDLPGVEKRDAPELKRPYEVARWFALAALLVLTLELWAFHRRW